MTRHTEEEIRRMFADMGLESESEREKFKQLAEKEEGHDPPEQGFIIRPEMSSNAPEEPHSA